MVEKIDINSENNEVVFLFCDFFFLWLVVLVFCDGYLVLVLLAFGVHGGCLIYYCDLSIPHKLDLQSVFFPLEMGNANLFPADILCGHNFRSAAFGFAYSTNIISITSFFGFDNTFSIIQKYYFLSRKTCQIFLKIV